MLDQEVTNTEDIVIDVEEEDVTTDEEEIEEEQTDEEKEELRRELEDLKQKNAKLYDKLKSWYKKGKETKDSLKRDYVSKEDVRKIFDEVQKDKEDEANLVAKYEDAKDLLPEAKKIATEKGLSITDAYALVKWKMFDDEWYRNQIHSQRTALNGDVVKKEAWFKYAHLFTTPAVSKPRKED